MTLYELENELKHWRKIAETGNDRISKDGADQIVALIEAEIHKLKDKANGEQE